MARPRLNLTSPGGERLVVAGWEAGGGARLVVKGWLQITLEEAPDTLAKDLLGHQTANAAELIEPTHPNRHMADLVAIDAVQDSGALRIADPLEPSRHLRRHVEPPRLEHKRNDGKARKQVIGGRRRRFPQAVMRGQITIPGSEIGEPPRQQLEMMRLLRSYSDPIVEEGAG